ncbi:hydroxypyruvate isomerase family protein [Flavivirga rizhaonensis]|uniref:Xylose isomerase n=1 Tax=Flavivirga rizhaonensis TaxID=2559571 RepID=A0A4S1DZC6_9FLAO|nr:TIM barrel protein [Flavivirga rizhaonensis]TGV03509.1 xylose isomerase [Flavivirga rizhaonensis]
MKRRLFIKKSTATASLIGMSLSGVHALNKLHSNTNKNTFKLNFAPHIGMFKHHAGNNPIDQLNFMADQGFTAFEDNNMKNRPVEVQKSMAKTMVDRNITMGVFVAHKIYWKAPNLASGNIDKRHEFLNEIKQSVEVAKRVNAQWITVVPGHVDLKQNMAYQTEHVIETLKQASAILEPHQITMVLEPLNFRDHPGLFLTESPQAFQICKAVNSPSCKILFDIYHQQIQEGNLIPNIEACWDEIAYFQIGDNPGRKEPTTGEINYKNIFKYIHSRGYKGVLGMEHGNSIDGIEGELAVLKAYRSSAS